MKLGKQTIVFLAVNKNGDEVILDNFPVRQGEVWTDYLPSYGFLFLFIFFFLSHNSSFILFL